MPSILQNHRLTQTPVMQKLRAVRDKLQHSETLEFTFLVVVLFLLLPLYLQLPAILEHGDQRYAPNYLQDVQLPSRVLPSICKQSGGLASESLQAVCTANYKKIALGNTPPSENLPIELQTQKKQLGQAFANPIQDPLNQIDRDRRSLEQGLADKSLEDSQARITELDSAVRPYLATYDLINKGTLKAGPQSLQCLMGKLAESAWRDLASPESRASLSIWLASNIDGLNPGDLPDDAYLALQKNWHGQGACQSFSSPIAAADSLREVVHGARDRASKAHKATGMRTLLANAWWQWPLWALLGYVFLALSRRRLAVLPATGLALLLWAAAAWASRVFLPFSDELNLDWNLPRPFTLPPWPLMWMLAVGLLLWLVGHIVARRCKPADALVIRQTSGSRLGYPVFVLVTGIGWLLLLDLSATAYQKNRFLGLYQQGYLWSGFVLLTLVLLWRQHIANFFTRSLALLASISRKIARTLPGGNWTGFVVTGLLIIALFWLVKNNRQITSEIGRLWLIFGAAWFFYVRGDLALDENHFRASAWRWLLHFISPLLFVVGVLAGAMLVTDDMGPLLVSLYASGIFIAAAIMFALHRRGWSNAHAALIALLLLALWITGISEAVLTIGKLHTTTAARLESMETPLLSTNDQLAIITWFRQSAPDLGYGIGHVPWCGQMGTGICRGVPLQIHSDYTFSALWGLFGDWITGAIVWLTAYWLYHLAKYHPRATSGTPRTLIDQEGRRIPDTQAFISWLCIIWITLSVCQLAITVAGNLRVLPLTGITYPFMSFGITSLWVNFIFLGLCLNLSRYESVSDV